MNRTRMLTAGILILGIAACSTGPPAGSISREARAVGEQYDRARRAYFKCDRDETPAECDRLNAQMSRSSDEYSRLTNGRYVGDDFKMNHLADAILGVLPALATGAAMGLASAPVASANPRYSTASQYSTTPQFYNRYTQTYSSGGGSSGGNSSRGGGSAADCKALTESNPICLRLTNGAKNYLNQITAQNSQGIRGAAMQAYCVGYVSAEAYRGCADAIRPTSPSCAAMVMQDSNNIKQTSDEAKVTSAAVTSGDWRQECGWRG